MTLETEFMFTLLSGKQVLVRATGTAVVDGGVGYSDMTDIRIEYDMTDEVWTAKEIDELSNAEEAIGEEASESLWNTYEVEVAS